MNLTEQLTERRNSSAKVIPTEKLNIMQKSTAQLKTDGLSENSIQVGQTLPNFTLKNSNGESVSSHDFNSDFLVVSFYRGGWCPYCNMELKALQNILPKLKELNGELIAITPETPDSSVTTAEKNEISFPVLSDIDNAYAKQLGLAFQLPKELQDVYNDFGIDLVKHNENENFELPLPATYVVNKNREIIYNFAPVDYTQRLAPETILEVIKKH